MAFLENSSHCYLESLAQEGRRIIWCFQLASAFSEWKTLHWRVQEHRCIENDAAWARVHQCCCINAVTFVFKTQFLAHFPFSAKFIIGRIWDRLLAIIRYIGKIWDGREKVKSPIVWDFPDIWKTGFIWHIGRIWDGRQKEKSLIVWDFSDIRKNSLYFNKFISLMVEQ